MPVTLADVRAVAMALPRTTEGVVRGRTKFYIGRIVYLAFARDETVMGFAFPREWRKAAVDTEPDRFLMPTGGDLRYNWLLVRLDSIDAREMEELVVDAWAFVVPPKVAERHFAQVTPDHRFPAV